MVKSKKKRTLNSYYCFTWSLRFESPIRFEVSGRDGRLLSHGCRWPHWGDAAVLGGRKESKRRVCSGKHKGLNHISYDHQKIKHTCIWKPAVSLVYATLVAGFRRFRTRDIVTMCLYTDFFDIILNLRTLLVILLRKKKEFHLIVINAHNGKTEIIVVNVYTGITVKWIIGLYHVYMHIPTERFLCGWQDGSTPLMLATQNRHVEAMEILLSYGADTTYLNTVRSQSYIPYIASSSF